MRIVKKNKIIISEISTYEYNILVGSFLKKKAEQYIITNAFKGFKKKVKYYTLDKEKKQISLSRGLYYPLISFCKNNNIVISKEINQYKKNKQLELSSKIKKLRTFQQEITETLQLNDSGFIIVPTGGGKTIVMINEIIKRKTKTIVMVNNKNLMNQFKERLLDFTSIKEEDIGFFGNGKKDVDKDILIVLVQSFNKLKEKEIQDITSNYDLFFIDEVHHLIADTLTKVAENVNSKYFYGLTATPNKQFGVVEQILLKVLGPLIYQATEERLQEEGIILRPTFIPIINYDSFVLDFYQDYYKLDEGIIEKKYYANQFLDNGISFTSEYLIEGGPTIILCKDIKQLELFVRQLDEKLRSIAYIVKNSLFKGMSSYISNSKLVIAIDLAEDRKKVSNIKIKREVYYRRDRVILLNKVLIKELNDKKYVLVISDTIKHLEFMYNNLHPKLQDKSILFHGDLKNKEKKEREKEILNKDYNIIFAIDKFVGEGWDVPFLDSLIITQLIKDEENLKQLAGRVMRKKEGKTQCKIYDFVDINNVVTLSQFRKRFYNYYVKQTIYNKNNKRLEEVLNITN